MPGSLGRVDEIGRALTNFALLSPLARRLRGSLVEVTAFSYDATPCPLVNQPRYGESTSRPTLNRSLSLAMLLDFEVQRSSRRCAATDRLLEPGDLCYSVLEVQGADVVRRDYGSESWSSPPQSALGWWKWRVPELANKKIRLAPNEVLLQLFDQFADRSDQQDMRYVLALLLVRRRILRLDLPLDQRNFRVLDDPNEKTMSVYCPKRDASYEVPIRMPSGARIDEIQQQLSDLLVAGAA
jgi:hypothetical protein